MLAALLSGCTLLSPVPTLELIKAGGTMASAALATSAPAKASNTIRHGDVAVSQLCIEFNRNAPLQDLVPAIQAELKGLSVDSRVYEAGTGLQECSVWLRYVATIEWGIPPMGSGYRANLSAAALSLYGADGRLMASSSYLADDNHGMGRWAETRHKISPVVKALVGNDKT
ncbi:MAG: cell division protein FtsI [Roseateles depolymerans]|uniref:Cell division protein FtsI n=1 Tax=Roseateles depolymerans TaxID=76731 RepID=A0A2W5DXB0_9BURK|nr:MAG: cell division protein FtsI [Roseateles depolymerans]